MLASVANNSTIAPIEGNITVTSVYTFNDISCEGDSETFKIIVNPSPQVVFSEDNQFITSGETTASVDLTSPTSGVTFAWTAVADNGITGLTTTSGTTLILKRHYLILLQILNGHLHCCCIRKYRF